MTDIERARAIYQRAAEIFERDHAERMPLYEGSLVALEKAMDTVIPERQAMTDLTEARKAVEKMHEAFHHKTGTFGLYNASLDVALHIPAILRCLEAAEHAEALRAEGVLPKVSAW